jgi:hypothetical protein
MANKSGKHDLNNAVLYLETFPEILRQHLSTLAVPQSEELDEILELLSSKVEVVKAELGR